MKLWVAGLLAAALALGTVSAWAAEKFEDKSIKVAAETPEGFVKLDQLPAKDNFIGEAKGLYLSPEAATNAGAMLIHQMDLPGGVDFATFKGAIAPQLSQVFGNGYKLVKQEDTEIGKLSGFSLEFVCPGDGAKPAPGGTIPHHLRWYFFKDGDAKMIGVLYGARDASWKDLDAKFAASAKTLKRTE